MPYQIEITNLVRATGLTELGPVLVALRAVVRPWTG